ncbi:hypothetical protein, partial [Vagococcus salmoninarum]
LLTTYLIGINQYEKALNAQRFEIQEVNTSPMLLLLLGAGLFSLFSLTVIIILYGLTTALIELKQELILKKSEHLTKLLLGRTSRQLSQEILMEKFMMMPLIFFCSGSLSFWLFSLTAKTLERMFLLAGENFPHVIKTSLTFICLWLVLMLASLMCYYYWLKKKINTTA